MRWQTIVAVAVSGAALMSVEITTGRLLAPSFGDSLYVWGSLIGTLLLALSLGYWLGGHVADKHPARELLPLLLGLLGVSIMAIPLLNNTAIAASEHVPLLLAPLLATFILIFFASVIAGTISPCALKAESRKHEDLGKVSGALYAWATIGSVLGTFLTTFVLIRIMPVTAIYFAFGALVTLTAIPLLRTARTAILASVIVAVGVLLAAASVASSTAFAHATSGTEGTPIPGPVSVTLESPYGPIKVWDSNGLRALSIAGGQMSQMNVSNPSQDLPGWNYAEVMEIAFTAVTPQPTVLEIGLGAGTLARRCTEEHDCTIDVVDINPGVIDVAARYFGTVETNKRSITEADGREFLKKSRKTYDAILLDVMHHDKFGYRIPFHLTTREFFTLADEHVTKEGVVVMNIVTGAESMFFRSAVATVQSVFPNVVAYGTECCQVIVASRSSATIERYTQLAKEERRPIQRMKEATRIVPLPLTPRGDEIVLTDEYAPINAFPETVVGEKLEFVTTDPRMRAK